MSEPVLVADAISVVRNGRPLIEEVSLSVEPDDRILVQGPSGAGKTTLFAVLGLLEPPSSGELYIQGRNAADLPERERARLRRSFLGFIYQDFKLVPDLTARENAALPQEHAGDRDGALLDELFDRLKIAHVTEQYPATLSGGEKQRVAAARALANRPAVLLADEPTGQLDPDTADQLFELLRDVHAEFGTALITVSHDRRLEPHFESVIRLENGQFIE